MNNGDGVRGREANGGGDEGVNIICNSPKSTPKRKKKTAAAMDEE